jgi:aminoglycoside phosphotransferase family enzyme
MKSEEIEQLMCGESFREEHDAASLIETHISWVILTNQYAYKIKKPVQFSFLDFSTLEKRKYYCEREVFLNKRLTDQMYLGTIPVFKRGNSFSLNSQDGEVIDYAVFMRRMDTAKEMDKLLLAHKVNKQTIKGLAVKISEFHRQATIIKKKTEINILKERFNDLGIVQAFARDHLGDHYAGVIGQSVKQSGLFLDKYQYAINERISKGCTRDLHGDLHTGNIFLYKDPVIFDCIEFNDELRQIDILDEIAFLCMDLEAYDRKDLSRLLYQNYLMYSGIREDKEAGLLFHYYKCYRANVRAKINLFYAVNTDDRIMFDRKIQTGIRYLALLNGYLAKL